MSQPFSRQFPAALTWAGIALLTYLLYLIVQPFLIPLGWGCVIAVLIHPAFSRLAARIGSGRAAASATLIIAIVLIAPGIALTNAFAREMIGISQTLQTMFADGSRSGVEQVWAELIERLPAAAQIDLGAVGANALQQAASFLVSQSGSVLTNFAVFFLNLALALFATFFLLRDGDAIMHAIRRLLPMPPAEREKFITRTSDLIAAGVTSSVIVASLQGLLGGLTFAVLGLSAPVFWGVVMGFACLLPFGAAIVWLPAAIFLGLSGSVTKALVLLGLGVGVISMVDNVVRPLLLSGRANMNGLVIFVSLLGGLRVFGLLGIVLGPIVVVTAIAMVSSYVDSTPEPGHQAQP